MVFFCNWGNSFFGMVVFLLLFTSQAWSVKFVFPKKATKIDEIFTVDLTLCSKCQIGGEYFVNFCGLLRKINFNLHGSNLQYFVSGIEESILFWSFIKSRHVSKSKNLGGREVMAAPSVLPKTGPPLPPRLWHAWRGFRVRNISFRYLVF